MTAGISILSEVSPFVGCMAASMSPPFPVAGWAGSRVSGCVTEALEPRSPPNQPRAACTASAPSLSCSECLALKVHLCSPEEWTCKAGRPERSIRASLEKSAASSARLAGKRHQLGPRETLLNARKEARK